jgi:hypothetical protein
MEFIRQEWLGDPQQGLTTSPLTGVISAIDSFSWRIAVTGDGALWAWGAFGDTRFKEPVQVETHIRKIAQGEQILILKDDNTLYSIAGRSIEKLIGALGGKSDAHLLSDDSVHKELDDVLDMVPADWRMHGKDGYSLSILTLKTDGSLWARGFSQYGQLGDGMVLFVPAQVSK